MCLWLLPECSISVVESKSSSDLDTLSNVSAPSSQTARLDTQLLQSSASLDSSSVLPSPSASFEPIKPDPAGSEYAPGLSASPACATGGEGVAAGPRESS